MRDSLLLGGLAFIATLLGTAAYRPLARRLGVVAVPNERTLHQGIVPRGGGAVVAAVFLIGIGVLWARGELARNLALALVAGGGAVAVLGFVDDVVNLSTKTRIFAHAGIAVLATVVIGSLRHLELGGLAIDLGPLGSALTVLALMWTINLFNFMDGIDGMAGSGALVFCASATGILIWQGAPAAEVAPLALLGGASLGFLCFNWPPARLFLGDSGSGFYGYVFGVMVLVTGGGGRISLWTWVILLGYFIGDTTTTLLLRMRRVRRFWGTHRSHAYQNLARVWADHRKVTLRVLAIELGWLVPLALASVAWPRLGAPLAAIALAPVVALTYVYGPRYQQ